MLKLLSVLALTIFISGSSLWSAEKPKMSAVAPAAILTAEAEAIVKALDAALTDAESYDKAKKNVAKDFGLLAVIGQALAEHDEDSKLKAAAADLRDAAIQGAKAKTLEDAKKAFEGVKAAAEGKKGSAAVEHPWNKLMSLHHLMEVVNTRNGKIRRVARSIPSDTAEAERNAYVLALLSVAMAADTHEVKDKAQVPEWEKYSKEMQESMSGLGAALKKKDADAVKKTFAAAGKTCTDCHREIRDK
ncbi:MAG: cytochrome c [Planctomycetales bacterium]